MRSTIHSNHTLILRKDLFTLGQVQHGIYKAAPRDNYLEFSDTSSDCSSIMDFENDGFSVNEFDHLDGEDWKGIGDDLSNARDEEDEEEGGGNMGTLRNNVSVIPSLV